MVDDGVRETSPLPIRSGAFVAVVGPSGSGKDTLIGYARRRLTSDAAAVFIRRVITRPSDAAFEDHDTLADAAFDEALATGAFSVAWQAHGLKYGLPASVDRVLQEDRVAIANISRRAIPTVRERYATVMVVEIDAAPEILAARLSERGRETGEALLSRLGRTTVPEQPGSDLRRLDNSGDMSIAGEALTAIIRGVIERSVARARARPGET